MMIAVDPECVRPGHDQRGHILIERALVDHDA
jgi:hypothetical protein